MNRLYNILNNLALYTLYIVQCALMYVILNNLALCTLYTEQRVLVYTGGMVVVYLCA